MKLNIADPSTGRQKKIDIEDEIKLLPFYGEKIGNKVKGDFLGNEFKGYVFRVAGGDDKEGFPMMGGVMTDKRVKRLLRNNMKCFRPHRSGQMRRKSVRGCIVSGDLSVLHLTVHKAGPEGIPQLNSKDDEPRPNRLGPKRAGRIRKQFGVRIDQDLRKYVVRRTIAKGAAGQKDKQKAPKIQRLVTDRRIARKAHLKSLTKSRRLDAIRMKEEYDQMMQKWQKDQKERRINEASKKKKTAE